MALSQSQYPILRTEVTTDPVVLGYVGKTDQATADLLNSLTTGRTLPNTAVSSSSIFNQIVAGDWPTAGSQAADMLARLLGMQTLDASNANTKGIIAAVFPVGSTTRTNLLAISTTTVSRATELGLPSISALDVNHARSGVW